MGSTSETLSPAEITQTTIEAIGNATPTAPAWAFAGDLVLMVSTSALSLTMIMGTFLVFWRLHALKRGFGPLTFRLTAAFIFIPALFFVTITEKLDTAALTALWGAVAGYLLSEGTKSNGAERPENPSDRNRLQADANAEPSKSLDRDIVDTGQND